MSKFSLATGLVPAPLNRGRIRLRLGGLLVLSCIAVGCSADDLGVAQQAASGSWTLPEEVRAAGAQVNVQYDDAPGWDASACGSGLLPGGRALGAALEAQFSQISSIGGFSCRPNTANTSKMSVHGTGRALDVMVPDSSPEGDEVANWLVMNAQQIGVQLIIWDRTVWRADGSNTKRYGGPHPHNDHVHVEINEEAAAQRTPFFTNGARVDVPGAGTPPAPREPTDPQQPPVVTPQPVDPYEPPVDPGYPPYTPPTTPPATPSNPPYPGGPGSTGGIPTLPGGGTGASPGGGTVPTAGAAAPPPVTPPATPPRVPQTPPSLAQADDLPSGQPDSLGTGIRKPKTKAKAQPIESGCAAAPGSASSGSRFALGLLGLAVLLRRRRGK